MRSRHVLFMSVIIPLIGIFSRPSLLIAQAQPAQKINLKLLYAGQPGSEREKEFVEFLSGYLVSVKTGDFAKFTPAQADGVDVVLLDSDADGTGAIQMSRPAALPNTYTRPTMTLGMAPALYAGGMGLKTGYL
jgi:hypothetical protein